ncbi:MAG TPA: hypothetical protein VK726_26485 [Acetobacteraceae bacterium]|nr:hypothetical protein [Acetobacteraceae bacterium]
MQWRHRAVAGTVQVLGLVVEDIDGDTPLAGRGHVRHREQQFATIDTDLRDVAFRSGLALGGHEPMQIGQQVGGKPAGDMMKAVAPVGVDVAGHCSVFCLVAVGRSMTPPELLAIAYPKRPRLSPARTAPPSC